MTWCWPQKDPEHFLSEHERCDTGSSGATRLILLASWWPRDSLQAGSDGHGAEEDGGESILWYAGERPGYLSALPSC